LKRLGCKTRSSVLLAPAHGKGLRTCSVRGMRP